MSRCASLAKALREVLAELSVEPLVFLNNMAYYSVSVIKENLKIDRFCRVSLGEDENTCSHINDGHHEALQVSVQKMDSVFLFYENLVATICPLLLLSFIASWSDERGRKVPLLIAFAGFALYHAMYLLESIFTSWPPEILLFAAFLQSMGGGWNIVYMAAFSYMSDKTSARSRTVRMAVMNVAQQSGGPVGTALGAWVFAVGGYVWVYTLSLTLALLCILLTVLLIKDAVPTVTVDSSISSKTTSPWNPKNVIDLFKVFFKVRPNRGRIHLMILMSIMMGIVSSYPHNLYLWTRRVLLWDENDYSLYSMVLQLSNIVVTALVAFVLQRVSVHDCSVGAVSGLLVFIKLLTYGFLTTPDQWWVLYLFTIVPTEVTSVADRGLISKVCEPNEVGRLFSVLAILELLWHLADTALYTAVYTTTLEYYPSYEHLLCAFFGVGVMAGFLWLRVSMAGVEMRKGDVSIEEEGKKDGLSQGDAPEGKAGMSHKGD